MLAALRSPGEFLQVSCSCLQGLVISDCLLVYLGLPVLCLLILGLSSVWLRIMSWIKEGKLSLWERFCANIIKVSSGPQHPLTCSVG